MQQYRTIGYAARRMIAHLGWLDHDPEERDRMNRVLSLFAESESRDELGLAPIRDSISHLLVPGTSVLQTRLRYFLFVPWIYRALGVIGRLARGALKQLPNSAYWSGLGVIRSAARGSERA